MYKTSNYLLFDLGYIVYLMNVNCLCRAWFSCNKTHATIYHFCLYYPDSALTVDLVLFVDLHLGEVSSRFIILHQYKPKPLKKQILLIKVMAYIQTAQRKSAQRGNRAGSGRSFQFLQAAGCKYIQLYIHFISLLYSQLQDYCQAW